MSTLSPRSGAQFVSGIGDLPVLSAVSAELLRILETDDVQTRKVLMLLSQDPILSAKVVHLANSTFYGGLSSARLDQALMRIGFKELRNMALTSAVMEAFPDLGPGFNLRSYWQHCIASGMASHLVARAAPVLTEAERSSMEGGFYMCGLLHHLGILLHALYEPGPFRECLEACSRDGQVLWQAERRILGFDHSESGACLLERWAFPATVRNAVRFHHQPESAPEPERFTARVLHVSAMLCHGILGEQASYEGHVEGFDEEAWFGLGFQSSDMEAMHAGVQKAVQSSEQLVQELFS